ncbi:MAG: hypothetical protein KGN76_16995 [Acidobacteriota bacterium]|nr:hypothetical protein [Acidobacteriota bacterium]
MPKPAYRRPGASALIASWLTIVTSTAALAASPGSAQTASARIAPYLMASQEQEIALARTAAPPSVSTRATVMVLGAHGYFTAVKGSNGFVCLDERSWQAAVTVSRAGFWNPAINTPKCYNAVAVRSVLPEYLLKTQWVLAGASEAEIGDRLKAAWATGQLRTPPPGALGFMMSRLASGVGGPGPWRPHLMFYFPKGDVPNWGANLGGNPVFDSVREHVTVFFVLVPTWSDGSPAPHF